MAQFADSSRFFGRASRRALAIQGGTNGDGKHRSRHGQVGLDHRRHAERLSASGRELQQFAREHPKAQIDLPFLIGTIPNVKRLADAFRAAGRPVVYLAHVLKPDYSDAAFSYWRVGIEPASGNLTDCVEGTWGAQIIDELKPQEGEHLVVKKGFGGFSAPRVKLGEG
jgi:Isochorismatase family